MSHGEGIRLKWARFVIKLKYPAPGNSAKEKSRTQFFMRKKNRTIACHVVTVSVRWSPTG